MGTFGDQRPAVPIYPAFSDRCTVSPDVPNTIGKETDPRLRQMPARARDRPLIEYNFPILKSCDFTVFPSFIGVFILVVRDRQALAVIEDRDRDLISVSLRMDR